MTTETLWEKFCVEFPEVLCTATPEIVMEEFRRRGYRGEEDVPRFLAGVAFDGWWKADFTEGQTVVWYKNSRVKYVNAYVLGREYGGPEEGGWWYDTGEPVASTPLPYDATDDTVDAVKKNLQDLLGQDDLSIYVEDHYGEYFPKVRPHFE